MSPKIVTAAGCSWISVWPKIRSSAFIIASRRSLALDPYCWIKKGFSDALNR